MKISLDDFGTAYSSLSYLHSFPLHKVKIDQSFLQGLGDDERRVTLLRGITRLSAQLGLKVVVEGVETQEQLELLAAEDSIDEVQGYLLCRPMPAADLRKLLYASYVAPAQISSWPAKVRNTLPERKASDTAWTDVTSCLAVSAGRRLTLINRVNPNKSSKL